jgi:ABC-type dipeptide/oligopeptide/nickel transport system permease subunit
MRLTGLTIIVVLFLAAVAAPLLTGYDPLAQDLRSALQPPGTGHWLGTDLLGRDNFARLLYGTRTSLFVATAAVTVSALIGVSLGTLAGFYGGWLDSLVMRVGDIFLSFPAIVFALLMSSVLGPGTLNLLISLGLIGWAGFARVGRGMVLTVKEEMYVDTARCAGAGSWRLILRHILPNCLPQLGVYGAMGIGTMIMAEAGLSFLGVGVQPPTPSWGLMIYEAKNYLVNAPWLAYFPGAVIVVTVLGFNLLGEGLREHLDPRAKGMK